ncbi:hypothetical protein [Microbacterium sp.]|uniref:hypothetical protein n=1 Tax=Microbacterium sp. TaxID=51671 RepID=UPI0039E4EA57
MKNVTVAVPDEVYRRARVRAAEQGTSVSALVTRYLRTLAEEDAEFARLADLQRRTIEAIGTFRASDRVSREDVHARAIR